MKLWIAGLTALTLLLPAQAGAASAALSIQANEAFLAANATKPGVRTTRDGLQYKVLKAGFGKSPKDGDLVTVYYSLSLINGEKLEGSEPDFPSQMPVNEVISGWREALKIMREGDRWQLFVPSALGYGPSGSSNGGVPPNQTLVFDIELIKTVTPPPKPTKGDDDQSQGQGGGPGQ